VTGPETARRRPAQARSAATVAAVLGAARGLLHDGEELSARTIAARAGVAAPTVYRYFADIDAVVDALVIDHARAAEAMVERVLAADPGDDVAMTFGRVFDGYVELYEAHPELTVVWSSPEMAERQRLIEERSDRSLAKRLSDHLVEGGAVDRKDRRSVESRVETYWQMAGVALAAVLDAPGPRARRVAEDDARAFVAHAAMRCAAVPGHDRRADATVDRRQK
jgi:AcrR family transcriptional regulator